MHIERVTDQMLDRVLESARSPVAVLFVAGDRDRQSFVRSRFEKIPDDGLDEMVIFLELDADENPTPAAKFMGPAFSDDAPRIVVFKGGKVWGSMEGSCSHRDIEDFIEYCLKGKH